MCVLYIIYLNKYKIDQKYIKHNEKTDGNFMCLTGNETEQLNVLNDTSNDGAICG